MKITVKPQHTTKETPYPKLMASIHTSLIVFTKLLEGHYSADHGCFSVGTGV